MTRPSKLALVTSTIYEMVRIVVQDAAPGATVKVAPPRAISPGAPPEVNVYCYQITPNETHRNDSLALRNAAGAQVQEDHIAVDLHYLITFSGEDDYASERMAEAVIGQFNLFPTITDEAVKKLSGVLPIGGKEPPTLLRPVNLTPQYLRLDELNKLWTVFSQAAHRLSVQYVASPVLFTAPTPNAIVRSPSPADVAQRTIR